MLLPRGDVRRKPEYPEQTNRRPCQQVLRDAIYARGLKSWRSKDRRSLIPIMLLRHVFLLKSVYKSLTSAQTMTSSLRRPRRGTSLESFASSCLRFGAESWTETRSRRCLQGVIGAVVIETTSWSVSMPVVLLQPGP